MSDNEYRSIEDQEFTYKEIIKDSLKMGLISFGGPIAHVGLFNNEFVKSKKIINEEKFIFFLSLCNILPGPTSSQLLTTIFLYKTKSIFCGLISFLCFNLPGLVIIIFCALLSNKIDYNINDVNFIYFTTRIIWQIACALVLQAGINLLKKLSNSNFQKILVLFSLILYLIYNNYVIMLIIMILCGISSYYKRESNYLIPEYEIDDTFTNLKFLGFPSLLLWILIYIIINIFNLNNTYIIISLLEKFYRIGSFVIGGGHVVIPMIISEFENSNIIKDIDVYNAFSIVSLLPGPMFNMAGYIGTLVNGVLGGFLSALCLFIPGILFLFTGLGLQNAIFIKKPELQYVVKGISSAAIGFIFCAFVRIWYISCYNIPFYATILGSANVLFSYFLLEYFKNYKLNIFIVYFYGLICIIICNLIV